MKRIKLTKICLLCLNICLFACADVMAYKVGAGSACKSPDSHPDAKAFYDKVDSFPNWSPNFYKKYGDLKESHYGSSNDSYVDSSDIHYHVGHGGDKWDWGNWKTLRAIIFDGSAMVPSEAKKRWGNNNLEWIGFRCCKLLEDKSRGYWANSMDKLHLLCGFKTNSYARDDFGKIWAEQMQLKNKIYQAWFTALDQTNQNGVVARVLAEASGNFDDRLWGYGYVSSDPSVDKYYHYKDHPSGSPPYLFVDFLPEMFIYEVQPRSVDEDYIRTIGNAFGFGLADPVQDHGDYLLMSRLQVPGADPCDPNLMIHTLQVYTNSGQYYYLNTATLWPTETNLQFPSPTAAHSIAEGFLGTNALHLSDAGSWDVEYSTLNLAEVNEVTPLETHQIGCAVSYAREIEAYAGTFVTVAGAGARLRVYIDHTSGVAGAMGNWRNITQNGTVPVLTKEEVWDRFKLHGPKVSVEPILLEYNRVETDLMTATLAYYEQPGPDLQGRLIPIWIFAVDYYDGDLLLTTANTFVPAAAQFYPPVANISSPDDGSEYNAGDIIDFNSVTDPNYGTPSYTYEWTSDIDGLLSTDPNFTGSLSIACTADGNSIEVVPHTVKLKITDSMGRSSSESVDVTIKRLSGDINCDNKVDFQDFAVMANQWLKP